MKNLKAGSPIHDIDNPKIAAKFLKIGCMTMEHAYIYVLLNSYYGFDKIYFEKSEWDFIGNTIRTKELRSQIHFPDTLPVRFIQEICDISFPVIESLFRDGAVTIGDLRKKVEEVHNGCSIKGIGPKSIGILDKARITLDEHNLKALLSAEDICGDFGLRRKE